MSKVLKQSKITSRGQVTLPKAWRDEFDSKRVTFVKKRNGILEIHPVDNEDEWETIFDAKVDGKMSIDTLIGMIQDINNE